MTNDKATIKQNKKPSVRQPGQNGSCHTLSYCKIPLGWLLLPPTQSLSILAILRGWGRVSETNQKWTGKRKSKFTCWCWNSLFLHFHLQQGYLRLSAWKTSLPFFLFVFSHHRIPVFSWDKLLLFPALFPNPPPPLRYLTFH